MPEELCVNVPGPKGRSVEFNVVVDCASGSEVPAALGSV